MEQPHKNDSGAGQPAFSLKGKRVWVPGHTGMVGSALTVALSRHDCEVLTAPRHELDLRRQDQVESWIGEHRPQAVFLAAATVGGIQANDSRPGDFLYDNLAIQTHVIHAAAEFGVEKLLFLGSSCFYPRLADQPIREDSLLTGLLEPTNEWYAVAKIAGAKLCQAYRRQRGVDFITAVPTNLYGPGDNFDPESSHVIPALIRRFLEARRNSSPAVEIWGSGTPRREFLFVEDAVDALLFLMERYSDEAIINVAGGEDVSIGELANTISEITGYRSALEFDTSRPDGMPRKQLSAEKILAMGWRPRTSLRDGLTRTCEWFESCAADGS